MSDPRATAARVVTDVADRGRSLSAVLPAASQRVERESRALTAELAYGTLRWYYQLDFLLKPLLRKPFKARDNDVRALLLVGFYQILHMRVPDHAAVSTTVDGVKALGKDWARGVVNGVLRNFLRQREALLAAAREDDQAAHAHPAWLLQRLQQDWPHDWQAVAAANNGYPPLTLRVNPRRGGREAYIKRLQQAGLAAVPALHNAWGLTLAQAVPVERLPGFTTGDVSVQDAAAQLAAELLDPAPAGRILDACAAPGGKTGHIGELAPQARLLALDRDPQRLAGVGDNLRRLGLSADTVAADAAETTAWWDGEAFDRILLDAPCSGTGVIRRHPDIKLLRRADDIPRLVQEQARLLEALWPLLGRGGMLLYCTCSVVQAENEQQIARFLAHHADAREQPIEADWGRARQAGRQILPGEDDMDGFFYARLVKH